MVCISSVGIAVLFFFQALVGFAGVDLQPHQKYTVDYLNSHPNQKGILLFHELGSGKTYLSLAYTESHPKKKVIVLLPRFLKSNWLSQMASYGVKDPSRYELVAMREAHRVLEKRDLSDTILIVDEIHKLVERIRYARQAESQNYSDLYFQLNRAAKIIALTGTPIFTSASDIAFVGNLISGQETFPYHPEQFRQKYLAIRPVRSLVRGHFFESKWTMVVLPFWSTLFAVFAFAGSGPLGAVLIPAVALAGSAIVPQANEFFPVREIPLREFRADLLKDFASQYVSFYTGGTEKIADYPDTILKPSRVHFTNPQLDMFLEFADEDLPLGRLKMMLEDGSSLKYTDSYLRINSHAIQRELLGIPTSGRQIGNFRLKNREGELVESQKFLEILNHIESQPGDQVAVYSNYYRSGIVKFAEFLQRHGHKDDFAILTPLQDVEKQIKIVENYNSGKTRILLIHPEITEGISLKATRQLHILEPISNIALQKQIIGRAVRYQSHARLPKADRNVRVYLWEAYVDYATLGYVPTRAAFIRKSHWQKRHSEVNPSMWTKGILEIDPNFFRKDKAPDSKVLKNQRIVEADMKSFAELVSEYSIERL